ncbi:MAG TPA: hypothetical protein V6C85_11665 [Allocoleopsis sp.]
MADRKQLQPIASPLMKLDEASSAYRINKTSKYVDAGHGVTID